MLLRPLVDVWEDENSRKAQTPQIPTAKHNADSLMSSLIKQII